MSFFWLLLMGASRTMPSSSSSKAIRDRSGAVIRDRAGAIINAR